MKGSLRTCPRGHKYYKRSDCPVCPTCEKAKVPEDPRLARIAAPARRALQGIGVTRVEQLAKHREADVLALHGMGPKALAMLKAALAESGKAFKPPASRAATAMRLLFLLASLLVASALADPVPAVFHFKSGEESGGTVVSVSGRFFEVEREDGVRMRIPYEALAAIRIDGRLETGPFDRNEMRRLFSEAVIEGPTREASPRDTLAVTPGWAFRKPTEAGPEGHYLTFQGLMSLAYRSPILAANYEWAGTLPVSLVGSLSYEQWNGGGPDIDYEGNIYGLGGRAGIRRYLRHKQRWYIEADVAVFHFFTGMLDSDVTYGGLGPYVGYRKRFDWLVLDANLAWIHVFREPEVLPPEGEEHGERLLPMFYSRRSLESSLRVLYPLMRLEANLALGFKGY